MALQPGLDQQREQLLEHDGDDDSRRSLDQNYNPYAPGRQYNPDDNFYDTTGIVRGTPEPDIPRTRENHIRFPSLHQYFGQQQTSEEPDSYLLRDLHSTSRDDEYLSTHPPPEPVSRQFPEYSGNPNQQSNEGNFHVDNLTHNYYNEGGILPISAQAGASMDPDQNFSEDPYHFVPFPVSNGDNYELNTFLPIPDEEEENETLLESNGNSSETTPTDHIDHHNAPLQPVEPQQQQVYPEDVQLPVPNFHEQDPQRQYEIEQLQHLQDQQQQLQLQQQQLQEQQQQQLQEQQQQQLQQIPSGQGGQPYGPPIPPVPLGAPGYMYPDQNQYPQQQQQQQRPAGPPNLTVRLFHGNLVLDCPVSKVIRNEFKSYLQRAKGAANKDQNLEEPREFQFMRYSAVTANPEDFYKRFGLRQQLYARKRNTEIFICVTLYNETEDLLARTLQGIAKNILFLSRRSPEEGWGVESWRKIVVCIVADGRDKLNERTRMLMERLGVFQHGLAKNTVGNSPVNAHLYEYSTIIGVKDVRDTVSFGSLTYPMQIIFCLKEHNKGKINSHRWYFQALSRVLRPNFCVLIDAGTVPSNNSIYHLWRSFKMDNDVGGACGEIRASLGRGWKKLLTNPLVAAQNFEYKMSNILDKPMESVFGFITVLPGAFSAYRYQAVINEDVRKEIDEDKYSEPPIQDIVKKADPIYSDPVLRDTPLGQYFKGETQKLSGQSAGIFTANMYLAEDRILCFELVTKRNERWLLKYVKSAHATTDVPEKLSELVLQRRRWLNGSFFAAIYSISHVYHLWRSNHNILRKLILLVEFAYQTVSILFSWFGIGNFFLVFRILTKSLGDPSLGFSPGNVLGSVFLWLYCACIIAIFVLSFGNRPKGTKVFYTIVVCFFAVLMAYLLFASIYISVKSVMYTLCITGGHVTISFVFHNPLFRDLVVSLMSTYALYIVSSLLFLDPWHIITSSIQYVLITPSYINVLNVYAFCNLHDISWGTKGDDKLRNDLGFATIKNDEAVEFLLPNHLKIIEDSYQNATEILNTPAKHKEEVASEDDRTKDWYALFRSTVVLAWVFTNLALVAVVLNTAGLSAIAGDNTSSTNSDNLVDRLLTRRDLIPTSQSSITMITEYISKVALAVRQTTTTTTDTNSCGTLGVQGSLRTEIYLTVVLWSVAGLAAFRFVGALLYVLLRLFGLH